MKNVVTLILIILCQRLFADISYWNIYGASSTEYWISQSTYITNGNYAAEIKPNGPITASNQTQYKYLYQVFNIHTNYKYNLSGYILVNSKRYTAAMLKIRWYPELDGNGSYICDNNSLSVNGSNEQFIFRSVTNVSPPTNALSCKVELYFQYYKWTPFTSIYFDDIQFTCSSNTNINLLQNGDFEIIPQSSSFTNPPQTNLSPISTESKLTLDRKIFSPRQNERLSIYFVLPDKNYDVILRVVDKQGNIIRELFQYKSLTEPYPYYDGTISWDGKNEQGRNACTGIYFIYLEATNSMTGDIIRMKRVVAIARELR